MKTELRVVYKWSKEDQKLMYFPQYKGWFCWNYFYSHVSYSEGDFSFINCFDTMEELKDWMREEKEMAIAMKKEKDKHKDKTVKIMPMEEV